MFATSLNFDLAQSVCFIPEMQMGASECNSLCSLLVWEVFGFPTYDSILSRMAAVRPICLCDLNTFDNRPKGISYFTWRIDSEDETLMCEKSDLRALHRSENVVN